VTALTHRKKPVYCATLVGRPPMEDCYLAKATERLFLPLLQKVFPEIKDYWLPWEGVFHNIVVVSINKEYPGHAHKIMHGLWGQGQMSFCKAIVVVDSDVDLANPAQITDRLLQNLDVQSDLIFTKGILDVLDHSSPTPNFGSKIGIDLTARFPGEPKRIQSDYKSSASDISSKKILGRIKEKLDGVISARCFSLSQKNKNAFQRNLILFLGVENELKKQDDFYSKKIHKITESEPFNIIILYDAKIDLSDNSLLLWKMFNNVDPERDLFIKKGRVVINACRKYTGGRHPREWPDELSF
jgi:4-hydroxy-3-polyprenylbenzoate decarboxylase